LILLVDTGVAETPDGAPGAWASGMVAVAIFEYALRLLAASEDLTRYLYGTAAESPVSL
jgi:hypothetical protein